MSFYMVCIDEQDNVIATQVQWSCGARPTCVGGTGCAESSGCHVATRRFLPVLRSNERVGDTTSLLRRHHAAVSGSRSRRRPDHDKAGADGDGSPPRESWREDP